MKQSRKLWQGRFAETPDAEAVRFETSIFVDERLALDDIAGSLAHVKMLMCCGIIPPEDASSITGGLESIRGDLESGALAIDPTAEDIHSFIENELTARIGEAGKKLHTGRSRNDQIALDERLYLRRAVPGVRGKIITLIETLAAIAEKHRFSYMPGYTHLQRAQPVTLAHHLCAWGNMLRRDWERLGDALSRIALSPLGSGALAAATLPLDRRAAARELGFQGVTANSLDAVADRDYCVEIVSCLALLMTHLSRFCEEVVLWSSAEFGFIALSEAWSTGSSIMPQKKNPDFAELIRGRAGRVFGSLTALFVMLKGLPLSYNRDMQEDKQSLFDALDVTSDCLGVFTRMIGSASWNTDRMMAACTGGFANATDAAEYLVVKGAPFREAHEISARIVRLCIDRGCNIEDLPLSDLQAASPLFQDDLYAKLTPQACVAARNIPGGPAPEETARQIAALQGFCAEAGTSRGQGKAGGG